MNTETRIVCIRMYEYVNIYETSCGILSPEVKTCEWSFEINDALVDVNDGGTLLVIEKLFFDSSRD